MISVFKICVGLLLCACVDSACTPEAVKDALIQCLMNNHIGTFYQFPIIPSAKYQNLCSNTTCMTYCMELVAAPCTTQDHMIHIGNADHLTAAYLGLCDQTENTVKDALTCGSQVSNQDALNIISPFQLKVEYAYESSSENTTAICLDWITMKENLSSLISAKCSDATSLTYWQTFLNTVSHKCDSTLTPSWYTDYKQTSNDRCSGSGDILPTVLGVFLCVNAAMLLRNFFYTHLF